MRGGSASGITRPETPAQPEQALTLKDSVGGLIRQFPSELHFVVLSVGGAIALLAVLGSLYYVDASALEAFDVNNEIIFGVDLRGFNAPVIHVSGFNAPVIFAAGLLFAASWFALSRGREGCFPRWAWLGIAGFFAFMGIDELQAIHEHVPDWTGMDWQLVYLPVAVTGAVFWLAIFKSFLTGSLSRLLWVGGAAAWSLAQVSEFFEFRGDPDALSATAILILAEEVGEMVGSAMFVFAILIFVREGRRPASAESPTQQLA